MATATLSNHFKKQQLDGEIDVGSDTLKCALMTGEFVFNKDTHATWADVSASEIANGSGYATGGLTLTGVTLTEDDSNDRGQAAWSNPRWNATGELGEFAAALIYDDTSSDNTVVGCVEFGTSVSVPDTSYFELTSLILRLT